MKAFNFRLEQVLKVRRQQEKIQQKEFFKIQTEHQQAVTSLKDLFNKKKETFADLKIKQKAGFHTTVYLAHMKYAEKLDLDIDVQRLNVQKTEIALSNERKKLLEAVTKRKILENLKEKKLEEYNYELSLEEQKVLDDIASRNAQPF